MSSFLSSFWYPLTTGNRFPSIKSKTRFFFFFFFFFFMYLYFVLYLYCSARQRVALCLHYNYSRAVIVHRRFHNVAKLCGNSCQVALILCFKNLIWTHVDGVIFLLQLNRSTSMNRLIRRDVKSVGELESRYNALWNNFEK